MQPFIYSHDLGQGVYEIYRFAQPACRLQHCEKSQSNAFASGPVKKIDKHLLMLVDFGMPDRNRTYASGSGGRRSIP